MTDFLGQDRMYPGSATAMWKGTLVRDARKELQALVKLAHVFNPRAR